MSILRRQLIIEKTSPSGRSYPFIVLVREFAIEDWDSQEDIDASFIEMCKEECPDALQDPTHFIEDMTIPSTFVR